MKTIISIAIFSLVSAVIIISYVSAKSYEIKVVEVNPNAQTEITIIN